MYETGWTVGSSSTYYAHCGSRSVRAGIWTACAIGLPVTTGLPGGIPRFFAVVYPVYFALAEAMRNAPRARIAAWVLSGTLLLICAARFVNWQWVA